MAVNDNHHDDESRPFIPDPHGHAALTLVESLIHALMERGLLTRAEAVDIVGTATDVHADIAEAEGGTDPAIWRSHALLTVIAQSLSRDLANNHGPDGGDGADVSPD